MSKQMVADLKPGDKVNTPLLVNEKSLRSFRKKPGSFMSLALADRSGTITGVMWDNAEEADGTFQQGEVVMVEGRVEVYRNSPQLIVERVRRCGDDEYDRTDFLAGGNQDSDALLAELHGFINMVQEPHLRALLDHFFADEQFIAAFKVAPGAKALHHSHIGGLLEHTVGVTKILLAVEQCHPQLDLDILITGALLHDIGKLRELSVDIGIDYTDTGRLVGHIVHGDRMVTAAIAQIDGFPQQLADLVCHILLSHHGQREYGAPIEPMTAEACALHYADNLDAHVQYFQQVIDQGAGSGNRWSEYQKLFDRYIYLGTGNELPPDAQV